MIYDNDFADLEVNRGYWIQAAVRASYQPLVEPALFRSGDTLAMRRVVLLRRRDLLEKLRELEWEPVQNDRRYGFARNCPPLDARLDMSLHFCKLNHFCPDCWARYLVFPGYDRLLSACFDEEGVRNDACLLELHRRWRLDRKADEYCLQRFLTRLGRPKFEEYRRREVDLLRPRGAMVVHAAYYTTTCCVVRRSVLAVVGDPDKLPAELGQDYNVVPIRLRKRGDLVAPLARVCRYPKQLFSGSPADLARYLNITKGIRLFASYGSLRFSHIER